MTESTTQPFPISHEEWGEIMTLEEIRELWAEPGESVAEFSNRVYGVKFNFRSDSPGYDGELFIIQGGVLTGDPPRMLGRINGKLDYIYD